MEMRTIGVVRNDRKGPSDLLEKKGESLIWIYEEYEEGLYKIEENDYLQVIFEFHLADGYELKGTTQSGTIKGVFASRNPRRPSPIGITTVRLLQRNGRQLKVLGLDVLDGTPVLDIKPYAASMDAAEQKRVETEYWRRNPRREIVKHIRREDLDGVLAGAGELHGHFCTGLAMGVMAGAYAVNEIRQISDGMEDILALVETNNCFSDGVQYTTGCTFGNNALIYRDYGKTAVTLTARDGKGCRVSVRPDFREKRSRELPEFQELFDSVVKKRKGSEEERERYKKLARDASFAMLRIAFPTLFNAERVAINIPEYAPIYDSIQCARCGESAMATRIVERTGERLCIPCSKTGYNQLSGKGIEHIQ